jgi:acetolactate synthase-1/2/3 large subunit
MTTGRPGAVHLAFPFDTQKGTVSPDDIWADPRHTSFPALPAAPDPQAIAEAAKALSSAKRAVAICGGGVVIAGAMDPLLRLAGALDMPVATTVSGQGSIAETDPLAVGVVGSNGGVPATRAVVEDADLILFIGCRAGSVTTERWRHPAPGVRIVHIDSDPAVLSANYQTEEAIADDERLALEALADAVEKRAHGNGGAQRAAAAWKAKLAEFEPLAASDETPIRPERVIATLQRVADEDTIICADPGTPCPYFSGHYRWPRAGRHFITNRAHGALGFAMGAAIGAHYGRPGVKTIAVMGDGSFGMSVGELETVVRYRLPITFIVLSNSVYGWIKAGQRSGFGARFHNVDFTRTDHAAVASAYGIKSFRVEDPAELEATLAKALAAGEPTLVDIVTQPLDEAAAPVSEWVA